MSKTIKIHTGSLNTNNGLVVEWAPIALAIVPTIPKPNHWKSKHIILKIVLGQDSPSLELYYLNF